MGDIEWDDTPVIEEEVYDPDPALTEAFHADSEPIDVSQDSQEPHTLAVKILEPLLSFFRDGKKPAKGSARSLAAKAPPLVFFLSPAFPLRQPAPAFACLHPTCVTPAQFVTRPGSFPRTDVE
ncbi:hypothetical protein Taro_049214, partial [Colocasia esculenta]|nr:hypothetical protein [Colocasia esculenta]